MTAHEAIGQLRQMQIASLKQTQTPDGKNIFGEIADLISRQHQVILSAYCLIAPMEHSPLPSVVVVRAVADILRGGQ